eukprot:2375605-Rhodomonas_salina.2
MSPVPSPNTTDCDLSIPPPDLGVIESILFASSEILCSDAGRGVAGVSPEHCTAIDGQRYLSWLCGQSGWPRSSRQ